MKIKVITLRYSSTLGSLDSSALDALQSDREILSCTPHFHLVGDVLHLSLVLSWQEAPLAPEVLEAAREVIAKPDARTPQSSAGGRGLREDPAAGLSEADRALFQTLRRWRSETARKDGVPPYVVMTNKELLAVVLRRPTSRNALSQVEGFGPSKMKRYAESLLRVLQSEVAEVGGVMCDAQSEAVVIESAVAESAGTAAAAAVLKSLEVVASVEAVAASVGATSKARWDRVDWPNCGVILLKPWGVVALEPVANRMARFARRADSLRRGAGLGWRRQETAFC